MSHILSFSFILIFSILANLSYSQAEHSGNLLAFQTPEKDWVFQAADQSSNLMIDFKALQSTPYKIHIFSEDGLLVYADDLVFVPTTAIYSVEIDDLKKGRYLLSVSALGNDVYSHHFTKE